MRRRRFGRNGTVSAVGFGCMSFGGFYGPTTESCSMRAMAHALELGVDFWDTANVYGEGLCEALIGKFLTEDPARRRRITLATKFAIRRVADGTRALDNSADHISESLKGSMKRLGVDHIDLYYVHRVDRRIPIEDMIAALARHVKAGLIGGIGLSEAAPDTLRRAHAVYPIAAVQSEYSLWTRNPELGLIQACNETGAALVAFSPLGRGYFSGLLQEVETFGERDFRAANPRFLGLNWRRNRDRLKPYLELAKSWGVRPSTLAVAWTLAKAPHVVPIPGTRTADHLEECAEAADIDLTETQLAELERVLLSASPPASATPINNGSESRNTDSAGPGAARVSAAGLDEIGPATHMRVSLLEPPLSLGVLFTILNVLLIVHAARTGRFMPWGFVLLFLPGIGALIYVAFELAPQWFGSYGAQRARRTVASALNPTGRYRALNDELDVVDTIANRSALADECVAIGRPQEALEHYEAILARPLGDEPAYRIGKARALLDLGRADEAVAALDGVKRVSPDIHSPEGRLLYARALDVAGRGEEALNQYASLARTYPGPEPSVRQAQLLERLGRRDQARSIADEVVRSLRRAPAHVRANEREWFSLANRLAR